MENKLLMAALAYMKNGFSVIPVNPKTKRASLKSWKRYQEKTADADQLREWFNDPTKTGIAIVTGKVSGLTVVDVDSDKGRDALEEFLPDSLITPAVKTPRGKHLYFRYTPGIENKVKVITDCDVRNDGGCVVAPPSRNGNSVYAWFEGLSPPDVKPAPMPEMLSEILRDTSAHSSAHINKEYSSRCDNMLSVTTKRQQLTTSDNIGFSEGYRDNTLFRLANCCIKGGMDVVTL